jgi:uncharacterized membrane protein YjfL (UPF0719 family)
MDWISQHVRPVVDSVLYSVLGTLVLVGAVWFIEWIIPFSVKKEIEEDQNTALGIILGAVILGISLIIAAAIHG